jgi:hypothetical protein
LDSKNIYIYHKIQFKISGARQPQFYKKTNAKGL